MWDPQAPRLVAGNWGSQAAPCPSAWKFFHQQAALSFGQSLGTPGAPTPNLGLCCSQSYSKRTFPHRRRGLGQRRGRPSPSVVGGLGPPSCFSGFPGRRVPLPHPRVSLSEAKLRAGECQHRRHSTWLAVPAGDPSVLGSSVLFTTPGRSRANTAFPPHGPVTSSPCLNSRWANRWR